MSCVPHCHASYMGLQFCHFPFPKNLMRHKIQITVIANLGFKVTKCRKVQDYYLWRALYVLAPGRVHRSRDCTNNKTHNPKNPEHNFYSGYSFRGCGNSRPPTAVILWLTSSAGLPHLPCCCSLRVQYYSKQPPGAQHPSVKTRLCLWNTYMHIHTHTRQMDSS